MSGDSEHPVTLGDLRVASPRDYRGNEDRNQYRSATVADLVSALRAEGVVVIQKDADGDWPEWAMNQGNEMWRRISKFVLDALAEAQPVPPAGR